MTPDQQIKAAEKAALAEPEDCEDGHEWTRYGTAQDGTEFYRCRRCRFEPGEPEMPAWNRSMWKLREE